jgi:intracellular sulfur oxidation DsrE/DsrF family protein
MHHSLLHLFIGSFAALGLVMAGAAHAAKNDCPVGVLPGSPGEAGTTLDMEFGEGTSGITRCIKRRDNVSVVMQVNKFCRDAVANPDCADNRAYALGNMRNMIKDYEITHGMLPGRDYEIVAVVHSGGWGLLVKDGYSFENLAGGKGTPGTKTLSNQFQGQVEELLAKGVRFLFCQNTTRGQISRGNLPEVSETSGGGATGALIDGVEFTTAGVTAIADFQDHGYRYVQP